MMGSDRCAFTLAVLWPWAGISDDSFLPMSREITPMAGWTTPVARLTPMEPARPFVSNSMAGIGGADPAGLPAPYSASTEFVNPAGMTMAA